MNNNIELDFGPFYYPKGICMTRNKDKKSKTARASRPPAFRADAQSALGVENPGQDPKRDEEKTSRKLHWQG
jgi:hypothetical protein